MKKNIDRYLIFIIFTGLIAIIYFSLGISSWKFSFVGDEWTFYSFAKSISDNGIINPFTLKGAYPDSPILGSIFQAIFIKIFGFSNEAWRFSNIILILPLSIFFYLWLKKLFDQHTSFISTIILQSSFYLANFFKIGKPIPLSLVFFVLLLYLGLCCIKQKPLIEIMFFGLILGISFYIYIGPIFPLIFYPYLLFIFYKKMGLTQILKYVSIVTLFYFILISPALGQIFFDKSYFEFAAKKTILKKEFKSQIQIFVNIFHNFLLFFKNYDYNFNHFVSSPYLDLISRFSALIGIIISFLYIKKRSFSILLSVFLLTAFVIGLTSPYNYAPTTRGIFFIPIGCAFAGIGINSLLIRFHKLRWLFVSIILLMILGINLYQSQIGVFNNFRFNQTSRILKLLQENDNKDMRLILLLSENNSYNYNNIYILKQAYNLNHIVFEVVKSNEFQCQKIEKSNLLILEDDKLVRQIINNNKCINNYQVI